MSTLVVGPNDVVLRQIPGAADITCLCSNLSPRWTYSSPTPLLEQRGLSAQVLQQELNTIESVCQQRYDAGKNPNLKRICAIVTVIDIILLVVMLVVMLGASTYNSTLTMISGMVIGLSFWGMGFWWFRNLKQTMEGVLEGLKQHLEVELNGKYQKSSGIRWTLQEERVYSGKNSVLYYHIVVSCVDVAQQAQAQSAVQPQVVQVQGYQQQQQPAVLYVDQNGNPINVQQVRVVVVDQNSAANPPADTQPAEELPPYEGTTYT